MPEAQAGLARPRIVQDGIAIYSRRAGVPSADALVSTVPLEISTLPRAFVGKASKDFQHQPVRTSAAIYDNDRRILADYADRAAYLPNHYDDPAELPLERAERATRIPGKAVYLGPLSAHFGHFLLETLPRAWALPLIPPDVKVIVHSILGSVQLKGYAAEMLGALGVKQDRLVAANKDLVVDELLLPSCQHWLLWKTSKNFGECFRAVVHGLDVSSNPASTPDKRIYFTRRHLIARTREDVSGALTGALGRSYVNEDLIERCFARHGFEIVAPETLSLRDQIRIVQSASHIAGCTGSAMHLVAFSFNPSLVAISIDTRVSRSQLQIEAGKGLTAHHIYARHSKDAHGAFVADIPLVEEVLDGLFA